jgi:hypothetical protein
VTEEAPLGIKRLTLTNWTEADPTNHNFARYSPFLEGMVPMDSGDWARLFLAFELEDHVPVEVRDLFEVARGAILYGWFFYPMFHLGQDQLFRVSETAARRCSNLLGEKDDRRSFFKCIEFLVKEGAIASGDRRRWEAARERRNSSSHPERAELLPPGVIASMVDTTATDINDLFRAATRFRRTAD